MAPLNAAFLDRFIFSYFLINYYISLSGERPDELCCLFDPTTQLMIAVDAIWIYHHPALHRSSCDIEFGDVLFLQGAFICVLADSNNQRVFPDANQQVAVQQETNAAEHLLFRDATLTREEMANAFDK
jgi:hypothetical protein